MTTALICTALLGLLVFALGLGVSMMRGSTGTVSGYTADPTNALYKMVRAHGNATEYAPMMAILMLAVAAREPAAWMLWTFVVATVSRYLHAAGMILSPSLQRPQPLRFLGALGTYLSGLALAVALLLRI
jgi:uncharacterized membrane protein YecN with MAPEG domain